MLSIDVNLLELLGLLAVVLHFLGIIAAWHAIVYTRTSQGAIAWAILLVMLPYVTLPAYILFGRGKFQGYVRARRAGDTEIDHVARTLEKKVRMFRHRAEEVDEDYQALERLAKMPFTSHNEAKLLIDGQQTFDAIFRGIESATDYILVQFYILRDDELGRELKSRLERKARDGVRVLVLYDEIGTRLPKSYCRAMAKVGIRILPFRSSRGLRNRFQVNFRNHRKIVVVDGRIAFVGGLNVGDEYLGRSKRFGTWRDTHVEVTGPIVQAVQLTFLEDWYWAAGDVPPLKWVPQPDDDANQIALVLPSGPADALETCGLFFVHAINAARRRIWISSPYFVPDAQVVCALQLAALRGADVRVMLPERPDHWLVYLSSFSFIAEAAPVGVKFYRYQPGFLHQKVLLVDDDLAAVGTANLDNRSIRLNFELTVLFADRKFAAAVAQMLEEDFRQCRVADPGDLATHGFWFRLGVPIARLMAPIQ
jgi:cardiolipin synthase